MNRYFLVLAAAGDVVTCSSHELFSGDRGTGDKR